MSSLHTPKPGASHFTYGDYRTWPENERWELIGGRAWNMSPAPSWGHQKLLHIISRELGNFLKGKPCQPFIAPVNVFLPEAGQNGSDLDSIDTVVQPDIGVVCDPTKIIPRGVIGAPDLVMEILSPNSVLRDMNLKKDLYASHGCREYWVWDAKLSWVTRFVLQADRHWDAGTAYDPSQTAESVIIPGFKFSLPDLRTEMGIKD